MPRVTKADLERENTELKAELENRRERSRSRHRKAQFDAASMGATARRALDVVRKHDRDGVVEEQRATIARLVQERAALVAQHTQEKTALEEGAGKMAPIILKAWGDFDFLPHSVETILANEESVIDFVKQMKEVMRTLASEFTWGTSVGRVMTTI